MRTHFLNALTACLTTLAIAGATMAFSGGNQSGPLANDRDGGARPTEDNPFGTPYGDDVYNDDQDPQGDPSNSASPFASPNGGGTPFAGPDSPHTGQPDFGDRGPEPGRNPKDGFGTPFGDDVFNPKDPGPTTLPATLDCNGNGQPDTDEIAADGFLDQDNDGKLDHCRRRGDVDSDGDVDIDDLIVTFLDWGVCSGCPTDLTDDGVVNERDIVELFAQWQAYD